MVFVFNDLTASGGDMRREEFVEENRSGDGCLGLTIWGRFWRLVSVRGPLCVACYRKKGFNRQGQTGWEQDGFSETDRTASQMVMA